MSLDWQTIEKLKASGMLRGKFDDYMRIIKVYKEELSNTGGLRMQAVTNTSERVNKCERVVFRAIKLSDEFR